MMKDCFWEYELLDCSRLLKTLNRFVEAAGDDPRIGPVHVSLFTALLLSERTPGRDLVLRRKSLMRLSRIRSRSTYYHCLSVLHAAGYVNYYPSRDPFGGSTVKINR